MRLIDQRRAQILGLPANPTPQKPKAATPPVPPPARSGRPSARARQRGGVAVVLAARNQARWLGQALRSVVTQSLRPVEVIYADDGSEDNSIAVAAGFRDVRIVPGRQGGVCAARRAGYSKLRHNYYDAPYVLFCDGDDILSRDLLAEAVEALDADLSLGAAYPRLLRYHEDVGDDVIGSWHSDQTWDYDRLAEQNYIGQATVLRREAFEAAGGWETDEDLWTPVDWWLWLRMSRAGWGFRLLGECAFLVYRQHSKQHSRIGQAEREEAYRRMQMRLPVTVFTPFSAGRREWSLDLWRENIARSGLPLERAHVIASDNMGDAEASRRLREMLAGLPLRGWTVLPVGAQIEGDSMAARICGLASPVNLFMCDLWRRALAVADGDLLWSLEDDVRVREGGYSRLAAALRPTTGIVGSPVASRWRTPPDVMVGMVESERPWRVAIREVAGMRFKDWGAARFEGVEEVGFLSVSSTVIRRSVWRGHAPMPSPLGDGCSSGHEHSLMRRCADVGRRVLCDWTTPADHLLDARTALTVEQWQEARARPDYYAAPQGMALVSAP